MNIRELAAIELQSALKRKQVQPLFNKQISAARYNYDEPTLKKMSSPYLAVELKAALADELKNMTIYKKPLNKYRKHEAYHELLNMNYNFSILTKKGKKKEQVEAPKRKRGRPKKNP